MGTFTVSTEPKPGEEAGSVSFIPDKKAETSSILLDQLTEKTGKSRALVAADLESYLEQMRQFINIGKPYIIEDIGAVSLAKNGDYQFTSNIGMALAVNTTQNEQHFLPGDNSMTNRLSKRNGVTSLALVVVLLIVAGIGWWVYSMVGHRDTTETVNSPADTPATTVEPAPPPPSETNAAAAGSTAVTADTLAVSKKPEPVAASSNAGSASYKFIFETTASAERARTRTEQLVSFGDPAHYDSVKQGDGSYAYRLFLRQQIAVADTARAKDSVQLYLSKNVTLVRE